jgi:PRC-barrel domain protein
MTAPIEDVSSLPGKKITDQEENPIGEVKEIFATEDGFPMWVSVEMSQGMSNKRTAFIPLARIKDENGDLRVPYSKDKIAESPEVDDSDGISEECDFQLRGYYGIGTGDQEMWSDNKSYATMVTEESASSEKADADDLETPDADQRTEESKERLEDPGSSEIRHVDAEAVAEGKEEEAGSDDEDSGGEDKDSQREEDGRDDDDGQPKDQKDSDEQPQGSKDDGDEKDRDRDSGHDEDAGSKSGE